LKKAKDMAKPLKPLASFNAERRALIHKPQAEKNGIECPQCGEELFDTDSSVTLTTDPPQTRVNCTDCGFVGTRLR
jgi:DNA-directed RNA polymerase subunit M/transcription elongation factor TFIIS